MDGGRNTKNYFSCKQRASDHARLILSCVRTILRTSREQFLGSIINAKKNQEEYDCEPNDLFASPEFALISNFFEQAPQYYGAPEADQNNRILNKFTETYLKQPSCLYVSPILQVFKDL